MRGSDQPGGLRGGATAAELVGGECRQTALVLGAQGALGMRGMGAGQPPPPRLCHSCRQLHWLCAQHRIAPRPPLTSSSPHRPAPPPSRAGICHLTALTALSRLDLMYSWKVTDDALRTLGGMTSLLSLNVLGCHRLTPGGKAGVAHLLDNTLDK